MSYLFFLVWNIKFIYSEKATKLCEISTLDLSYVVPVKSTGEISKNLVVFSEYMNFNSPYLNPLHIHRSCVIIIFVFSDEMAKFLSMHFAITPPEIPILPLCS